MLRVGLTGGIGSGKSSVSRRLASLGAVVVDYDLLAREVVEPGTPALAAIVERFGPDILTDDGALDRPALGAIVFSDDSARRDLEAITHGAVRDRAAEVEAGADPDAIVIHDIPLLAESRAMWSFDVVVVVDVPTDVQVQRLVEQRGMTEADARARIATQASREQRAAVADEIVDNSGPESELDALVGALWERLSSR